MIRRDIYIEEWKKIKGFENYSISNIGRIKNDNTNSIKKLGLDKDGYKVTTLWKKQRPYYKRVHRLVAEAFIDNPNNYDIVNHIDENKINNNKENLEWCTVGYNNRYSKSRKIIQIGIDGKFIKEWNCIKDAAVALNLHMTHIQSCCARKPHYITYGGYQWRYKEDYNLNYNYAIEKPMMNRGRGVIQFDIDGKLIKEYESLSKIPNVTISQRSTITAICNKKGRAKTCMGCLWEWK